MMGLQSSAYVLQLGAIVLQFLSTMRLELTTTSWDLCAPSKKALENLLYFYQWKLENLKQPVFLKPF